ncbi:transporter substrate-binding domain-containing protein [Vibrio sp. DNF-1]|nr:transporter substrate-binding domain-containing protein [Vibrio salinus]
MKWLPWARAFNLAKSGIYDGLIGAWFTEERLQYFSYSEPLLSTKLVVIKRKTNPTVYAKWTDLKKYRVGVALDSTPHELLKEELGENLEIGSSAYTNIQKLMAERFDLLVDEKLNVFYIINTHFPKWRDEIVVLSPPLQTNHLHLIISKKLMIISWLLKNSIKA